MLAVFWCFSLITLLAPLLRSRLDGVNITLFVVVLRKSPLARAFACVLTLPVSLLDLLRKYPEDLQFPNEIRKPHPKKR